MSLSLIPGETGPVRGQSGSEQPGFFTFAAFFKGPDLISMLQGQTDFIEALQQALLAECVDIENEGLAARRRDLLLFQVNI